MEGCSFYQRRLQISGPWLCFTNAQLDLELVPLLQERRKQLRLTFMFKVVEGVMPAIPSSSYFEPVPNKRRIRAIRFIEFEESTNIMTSHELNNNKCFSTKRCNTNIYRNSFFVRTVHDWNQLDNSTVSVTSVEAFRACLSRD